MRWPFTRYATGTLLLCVLVTGALAAAAALWAPGPTWLIPAALMLFCLWFFRDPERRAEGDELDLVSPADGLVADVVDVDDERLGPATRIGIFLSVVDVHVNRVPCAGTARARTIREGLFLDARHERATSDNASATVLFERPDGRPFVVKQIVGLIARRIVCPVVVGRTYARGERYGMIRFGSRTELLVPRDELETLYVAVGQSVRGGETLLLRLVPARPAREAPARPPRAATAP